MLSKLESLPDEEAIVDDIVVGEHGSFGVSCCSLSHFITSFLLITATLFFI